MAETPFLAELHGRFGLPRRVVASLAEQAVGRPVQRVERVVRGYDNEVHRVATADGPVVYVRIRRNGEGAFDQEVRAMARARDNGVPVPEVLAVEAASDVAEGLPVMVVAAAAGRSLEVLLPDASPTDRRQVLIRLGATLSRLHAVPTAGVWRPEASGRWPDPAKLRRGFIADRRAERELLLTGGLTTAEVDRVSQLLEVSPDPPLTGFVLCHGDVSPEHVFVDAELQVSALIDWGMWHGGSPVGELAYVATTFGWADLGAVTRGYGLESPTDEQGFRRGVATSAVGQLIGHIAHHMRIGDPQGARQNVAALRRALTIVDRDDCD